MGKYVYGRKIQILMSLGVERSNAIKKNEGKLRNYVAIRGPTIVVNRDLFFGISRRLYADKIEAINNISRKSCLSIYKT
jgi:hypothetical protein